MRERPGPALHSGPGGKPRARLRPGLVAGMGRDRPAAATFSGRRLGLYLIGAGVD